MRLNINIGSNREQQRLESEQVRQGNREGVDMQRSEKAGYSRRGCTIKGGLVVSRGQAQRKIKILIFCLKKN
jgi:hypothetical protein